MIYTKMSPNQAKDFAGLAEIGGAFWKILSERGVFVHRKEDFGVDVGYLVLSCRNDTENILAQNATAEEVVQVVIPFLTVEVFP